MTTMATHLMFQDGNARTAAELYVSLVPDSRIEEGGSDNPVSFTLAGNSYIAFESDVQHGFSFTPAMSIFVTCETADEVDAIFTGLIEGGEALMPLGDYGFSPRFGWCTDRFGVSWQVAQG